MMSEVKILAKKKSHSTQEQEVTRRALCDAVIEDE
jgi:hypothetical protein